MTLRDESESESSWDMNLFETTIDDYLAHKKEIDYESEYRIIDTITRMRDRFGIEKDGIYDSYWHDPENNINVIPCKGIVYCYIWAIPLENITKWKEYCQSKIDEALDEALDKMSTKEITKKKLRMKLGLDCNIRTQVSEDAMILEWLEKNISNNNLKERL